MGYNSIASVSQAFRGDTTVASAGTPQVNNNYVSNDSIAIAKEMKRLGNPDNSKVSSKKTENTSQNKSEVKDIPSNPVARLGLFLWLVKTVGQNQKK